LPLWLEARHRALDFAGNSWVGHPAHGVLKGRVMAMQPSPWRWISALLLAAVLLAPRPARAQTVTQTPGATLVAELPNGQPASHGDADATVITAAECEDSVDLQVPVNVTTPASGFAGYSLSGYATAIAGTDCGEPTNRTGPTAVCWQVMTAVVPVPQATYSIRVQDILRGIGQPPGFDPVYVAATDAACHTVPAGGPVPVLLELIVQDLGGNEVSNFEVGLTAEPAAASAEAPAPTEQAGCNVTGSGQPGTAALQAVALALVCGASARRRGAGADGRFATASTRSSRPRPATPPSA